MIDPWSVLHSCFSWFSSISSLFLPSFLITERQLLKSGTIWIFLTQSFRTYFAVFVNRQSVEVGRFQQRDFVITLTWNVQLVAPPLAPMQYQNYHLIHNEWIERNSTPYFCIKAALKTILVSDFYKSSLLILTSWSRKRRIASYQYTLALSRKIDLCCSDSWEVKWVAQNEP